MSGDPEQEYFADGLTETLITDLSRLENLFVIARNSVFTYKGKGVDVRQVGRELGVRYVLEGSVQKTAGRILVHVLLIEAGTGHHVWAERYDEDDEKLFDVQDEIVRRIIGEIDVKLMAGEDAFILARETRNVEAYHAVARGRAHMYQFTKEENERGRALFVQAIPIDFLPLESVKLPEQYGNMFWRSGQDILRAAMLIAADDRLHAVYLTNFACGPDSFVLSFFRTVMGKKPFLELEVDEHSADAGVLTRVEAFLDSVNLRSPPTRAKHDTVAGGVA
jgi:TolB-like protein